jgi:beta-phosphoglucomutase-like phosphatase (HAD superfamily)
MDGTLINSEELHWIAWRTTMENEGIALTRDEFLSTFGQRNDTMLTKL